MPHYKFADAMISGPEKNWCKIENVDINYSSFLISFCPAKYQIDIRKGMKMVPPTIVHGRACVRIISFLYHADDFTKKMVKR